jgi:hypothetical protein
MYTSGKKLEIICMERRPSGQNDLITEIKYLSA